MRFATILSSMVNNTLAHACFCLLNCFSYYLCFVLVKTVEKVKLVMSAFIFQDVSSKIMSFSQHGPRGICILSANGAISNVTLRQAATSGGTVTYEVCAILYFMSFVFLVNTQCNFSIFDKLALAVIDASLFSNCYMLRQLIWTTYRPNYFLHLWMCYSLNIIDFLNYASPNSDKKRKGLML